MQLMYIYFIYWIYNNTEYILLITVDENFLDYFRIRTLTILKMMNGSLSQK